MIFEGAKKEPFADAVGVDEEAMDELAEKFKAMHDGTGDGDEGDGKSEVESFVSMPESVFAATAGSFSGGTSAQDRL